ncbi:hypothetical protein BJ322DRAFT_450861 [Thelephora terrestris]|uniref:Uncharacterized protein n=1 Tax=Thelephora terrestris TaxID=56493 RepID=A0A9P6H568_9AGAM|nr:hypothetical protein BJ322DRAFT_450861 [Thelephora terrestris]
MPCNSPSPTFIALQLSPSALRLGVLLVPTATLHTNVHAVPTLPEFPARASRPIDQHQSLRCLLEVTLQTRDGSVVMITGLL